MEIIMKKITALCLAITLVGSISINPAWADRGHGGGGHYGGGYGGHHYDGYRGGHHNGFGYGALGLGLGLGLGYGVGNYYGGYNNYGYGYPPTVVTVPTAPPIYIQQTPAPVVQQIQNNYWYYCQNPKGYYPYVRECASGWQQVEPTPPR
jgi:hypothetical protein